LYEKEQKVFKGIICSIIDKEIFYLCKEFGISVFVKRGDSFVKPEFVIKQLSYSLFERQLKRRRNV